MTFHGTQTGYETLIFIFLMTSQMKGKWRRTARVWAAGATIASTVTAGTRQIVYLANMAAYSISK